VAILGLHGKHERHRVRVNLHSQRESRAWSNCKVQSVLEGWTGQNNISREKSCTDPRFCSKHAHLWRGIFHRLVPLGSRCRATPKRRNPRRSMAPQAPGAPWGGTLSTPRVPGQTKESGSTHRVTWEPNPFISTKNVRRKPYTPNGRGDGTHSFHPR